MRSVLHSMGCTHVPPAHDVPAAAEIRHETNDATDAATAAPRRAVADPDRSTGIRWFIALASGFAVWSPYGVATALAAALRSSGRGRRSAPVGDHTY